MSEKKDQKFPIKIKTLSNKSEGEDLSKPEEEDMEKNVKVSSREITSEISTRLEIVGQIPPWDNDEDSEPDDKSKPPTITAEIPSEEEKFHMIPRATGEIPPWDDEEERK